MPFPILEPESFLIITGAGTWNRVELIPLINSRIARNIYPGATPIRLIATEVTAGAKITRYLAFIFSAIIPTRKLNKEGILCIIDSSPARVLLIPSFSIRIGSACARKDVKVSWKRWADETKTIWFVLKSFCFGI